MKSLMSLFKAIIYGAVNIWRWIKSEYFDLVESFKFWRMKRQADAMHKKTGKRYHVLPTSNGNLVIVDNNFVEGHNKFIKGKGKPITIKDLLEMSYYSTSVNSPVLRERAKPKK